MKVLITAGPTMVPIDRVRFITNPFQGKTGAETANFIAGMGAEVTLLTPSPHLAREMANLRVIPFRTFDQLAELMEWHIKNEVFDAIIHSAAVSDFYVDEVLYKGPDGSLIPLDRDKKISSKHQKLYLGLAQTQKLVDQIRQPWGFQGKLVKFKLEVGKAYDELISIAIESVRQSKADFIVANCLEWYKESALIVYPDGSMTEIERADLPWQLWRRIQCEEYF